jgi:hypothetical protein
MVRRLAMTLWRWSNPGEYYAYCWHLIRVTEREHYGPPSPKAPELGS